MTNSSYFQDHALVLTGAANGIRVPYNKAYDFGRGDFTLEVWTRGHGMGVLVGRHSDEDPFRSPEDGRFMLALDQQGIRFELFTPMGSGGLHASANMLDGRWHHIALVRQQGRVSILLDARLMRTVTFGTLADLDAPIQTTLPLLIGQSSFLSRSSAQDKEITQVRIWSFARSSTEIEASMFHQLGGREAGLVGLWNFDEQDWRDTSPLGNHGQPTGVVSTRRTDMSLYPFGKPYLSVQTRLMQDYKAGSSGTEETSSYRVVLAPRTSTDQPSGVKVDLYAERDVDASVNDKPVRLTAETPYTVSPNLLGQITVAIAVDDTLTAPLIKVRPHFLDEAERILVAPDRHLHATMAQVTAKQLIGQDDPNAPIPELKEKDPLIAPGHLRQAEAAHKLVRNLMRSVSEYQALPATPHQELLAMAAGQPVEDGPQASPGNTRLPLPFRPSDDQARIDWEHAGSREVRLVAPEFMDEAHFEIDFAAGTFTPLTADEAYVRRNVDGVNSKFADPLAAVLASAPRRDDGAVELEIASFHSRYQTALAAHMVEGFDLFELFRNAVRVVVRTVTQVVREIGRVIQTVVVTVIDAAKSAVEAVIDVVGKAVAAVRGVFERVGAAANKVVNFFRSVFNWEDIKLVQSAISEFADQALRRTSMYVAEARAAANTKLVELRTQTSKAIKEQASRLAGVGFGSDGRQSNAPGGVQGSWIANRIVNSTDQWGSGLRPKLMNVSTDRLVPLQDDAHRAGEQANDLRIALEQWQGSTVLALAQAIDALLGRSIDLIGRVATTIFDMVEALIDAFRDLLDTRIEIPVVTELFEETILPGKTLTLRNAFSLAVAVPVAALYKTARGGSFEKLDRDVLHYLSTVRAESMDWLRLPPSASPSEGASMTAEEFSLMTGILGLVSSVCLVHYAPIQIMDDGAAALNADIAAQIVRVPGAIFLFLATLCAFPLNEDIILRGKAPTAPYSFATGVVGYAISCVVLLMYLATVVDAFKQAKLPPVKGPMRALEKLFVVCTCLSGVALFANAVCAVVALALERKEFYGGMLSQDCLFSAPLMGQVFLLARPSKWALVSPGLTAIGLIGGTAVAMGRSLHQIVTRGSDFHYRWS